MAAKPSAASLGQVDNDQNDYEFFNESCTNCGGGSYLGHFHGVALFENHTMIRCIPKSEDYTMSPFILPAYYKLLKSMEAATRNSANQFKQKVSNLIQVWKKCVNLVITTDHCAGTHTFLYYAANESSVLILNPDWGKKIPDRKKKEFIAIIEKIMLKFQKNNEGFINGERICHLLKSLIVKPWSHYHLLKLIHGNPTADEVSDLIHFERSYVYSLRIKMLCEENCESRALKLSSLVFQLLDNKLVETNLFSENDFDFIRDVYYACLYRLNKKKELIARLEELPIENEGKKLMNRYCIKIQYFINEQKELKPTINKHIVNVCEMAACIFVVKSLTNPKDIDEFTGLMKNWSYMISLLMKSTLKPDMNDVHVKDMIRNFIGVAPTSGHIFTMCDIIYHDFGPKLSQSFYMEIYMKALSLNIDEKERYKVLSDKNRSYEALKSLVQGYLKLANIIENITSVCRECVLTAYSLMPSSDLLVRVENLAIRSGKLFPEHSTNVPRNSCDRKPKGSIKKLEFIKSDIPDIKIQNFKTIKSDIHSKFIDRSLKDTYYKMRSDLDKLPDPLSPKMQEHLIAVLKIPRYDTFNWNLEWPKMKIICQQYLENLDIVINRNMIKRSDLIFLDFDSIERNKALGKINIKSLPYIDDFSDFSSSDSFSSDASSDDFVCYDRPSKSSNNIETSRQLRSLRVTRSSKVTNTLSSTSPSENKRIHEKNENSDDSTNSSSKRQPKAKAKNKKSAVKNKPQQAIKRVKRNVSKNQHKDFDYSWNKRGKSRKNNNTTNNELFNTNKVNLLNKELEKTLKNIKNEPLPSDQSFGLPHSSQEHLNMLSERIPQLSSLDYLIPMNRDHIVNVVQIQTTSNTLTNVSQTQTEHVSNHHSSNEIEKKPNDNQTNTHSLDNFVSAYQLNSINTNLNSAQSSGINQGECSFTGSVSVSNQRIASDSMTNVHTVNQQDINKSMDSHDASIDQNQGNIEHRRWNDIQMPSTGERLQSTVENSVHLSSNVIVRTSDVLPSQITQTSGQLTNATKKSSPYCIKNRDRFIDLSLPASISSTSVNSNRSTNISAMNSNKSIFDSKLQQNSSVQTSVGSQVNFNIRQSETIQSILSTNNQSSQICSSITESSSSNMSKLNEQLINSVNNQNNTSVMNSSFVKENNSFDTLKSNISIVNPVSSIQTQTCIGLRPSNEVSNSNASVISLVIASTQSQVIKSNVQNSLYTSSHNQRVQLSDLSQATQTNQSDEQKKIDNLKLISQTFTATSEAIKFVTSNTESQRLIQCTDKNNTPNRAIFQNTSDKVSNINQETELISKTSPNKTRGNMRTYESKTRALKQANMSDMFVFEKGTLYAVQDDNINQIESTKLAMSTKQNTLPSTKIQNRQVKESIEKPKPPPNASPNITITGSMLPRFQQVFGKTKYQSTNVINDVPSVCSTSAANNPSSPGPVINRTNILTSRVYSSSKGVQTSRDVDPISTNTMNCIAPKLLENKIQRNVSMTKNNNITSIGNNKNNVIMTCKTVSAVKTIPQVSASSSHQLLNNTVDTNNVKKEVSSTPIAKVSITFTTSCNTISTTSSSSNVIYSIPIQNDTKGNKNVGKLPQGVTQVQRQLKVSPSIIQTVLRKHPNWHQNCFRQGTQSTEVQTSSTIDRLIPTNISNTIKVDTLNDKIDTLSGNTNKPNVSESSVSSSMMEQVREFESVLEEVRKTSLLNEMSTASLLPQINHEIIQIHSPTENVDLLNTDSNQTLFPLNKKPNLNNQRDSCSFSFLNQSLSNVDELESEEKELRSSPSTIISVGSVTSTPPVTSPNNNSSSVNPVDGSTQCSKQIANKTKPVIKTPASSPSTSTVKVPVLQKPLPKLQEDEQTTQRIYAILDKYAEQLRNSPELKNKPAPRRRTNPPTNPSPNAKRKKSSQLNLKTCSQQTSCSSSGMEMSPTSDMQAIDSEDSSNAVSQFSHIINSPSRNADEQTTGTVISETPLIENALINVNDVIKQINVDSDIKSKVSQSTQIVVSGASGSFLSMPEGSGGNVRPLVAAGKNQKMYRLHCPVSVPGPVLIHQITTKDTSSNDVKISTSNILGQNINESTILSALTTDLQVTNSNLGNEIFLNTSQNSTVFEQKINKPTDIISESMEKAQVLDNTEKLMSFPVLKKSQASQSTFSVIHTLPCKSKSETSDKIELLSEAQNSISENVLKNLNGSDQQNAIIKEEFNNDSAIDQVLKQDNLKETHMKEPSSVTSENIKNTNIVFENVKFPSFHSQITNEKNEGSSNLNPKIIQQNKSNLDEKKLNNNTEPSTSSADCINDNKVSFETNNSTVVKCEGGEVVKQEKLSNTTTENTSNILSFPMEEKENKTSVLSDVAAASAAEIISTANQTSNNYKQKEKELSPKNIKTGCESHELENEKCLSNTVYNMLDNQSALNMNTKIGSLILSLTNDKSAENWNNCLSKIMPPGTEKMLEGENLKQLQDSFQYSKIKTYKDLKIFIFEQCKKLDNNVETSKEYDLYDDIDDLGVDKPSTNELFPEVAILNDLDKSLSPTLGLLQASSSKSNDLNALQARRKSVLSHTTTSSVINIDMEQTTNVSCKKNKTKVSFLKQALYNEMIQDVNDEIKPFVNGNKPVLEISEQIDSCPESPSNTTAVDSETCMSEDSTSTISSGAPHYNFRKSKRKNVEEDGFIESQVIKRMYRGRTSEENEDKSDISKTNNAKVQPTSNEQKSTLEKKDSNNRRLSNRLKNNNVKNNQHVSNKSPQPESPPSKITTTRASLRRISRKST